MSRMSRAQAHAMAKVLQEVRAERHRQHAKFGQQDHPDGTGIHFQGHAAIDHRACSMAFERGAGTYRHILQEEISEAYEESDPAQLRAELVQVAAVAVAWIEAIDRRSKR